MKRICVVSHNAFGAMVGGQSGHVGGVERQTTLLCRWFASRGYRMTLIVWDEGQESAAWIDGVNVIKMCSSHEGVPGLRFIHPRWTSLTRALRRADAELYYQNCGEYVTGQVALWCRSNRRKFVYSVASDPDCDRRLPEMKTLRERILYRYGIRHSDRIIVQTRKQEAMLRNGFGLPSLVLQMPCDGPSSGEYSAPDPPPERSGRILWVGRISSVKRLEVLLDVAERIPSVEFDVVGTADMDDSYTRDVIAKACKIRNVVLHGRVEFKQMPGFYRNASILCCTSSYEGFPNVFLEAWSYGLPVVSTVDPDGIIEEQRLGAAADDAVGIARSVADILEEPGRWREHSQNARKYYIENHAVDPAMRRFEILFQDVLEDWGGGRRT